MSVVEPNYWDGIIDGVNPRGKEFPDILDILDFPMESLDGDELNGDWDASKFLNFGPIPMDALTGLPPVSQGNIGSGLANRSRGFNSSIDKTSAQKELPSSPQQNLISSESSPFQTPSPVSVLESSGSCSSRKVLSIRSDIVIPVRARSKRARPSTGNPWLLVFPITSASVSSNASNRGRNKGKKKKKKKKKTPSHSSKPSEATRKSLQQVKKKLPEELVAEEKKETSFEHSVATKKCTHCEVTKTPQWREGPLGPKTLCNACGVRYRSGRLFPEYRPAASPTFIPFMHSNSHKKVVEMRRKATQQAVVVEELSMSPLPEFVPMSSSFVDYMY